jgi:hypothetical protein
MFSCATTAIGKLPSVTRLTLTTNQRLSVGEAQGYSMVNCPFRLDRTERSPSAKALAYSDCSPLARSQTSR